MLQTKQYYSRSVVPALGIARPALTTPGIRNTILRRRGISVWSRSLSFVKCSISRNISQVFRGKSPIHIIIIKGYATGVRRRLNFASILALIWKYGVYRGYSDFLSIRKINVDSLYAVLIHRHLFSHHKETKIALAIYIIYNNIIYTGHLTNRNLAPK